MSIEIDKYGLSIGNVTKFELTSDQKMVIVYIHPEYISDDIGIPLFKRDLAHLIKELQDIHNKMNDSKEE